MKRDPFLILGLKKTASESDVRKMQQKLATIYHSDVGGDEAATEKMKEINDAASECLKILRSK
jgi:curved DNA-binding protein CbpA